MAELNLYYLHFNNYYNRIIKKFDTLSEYLVDPYYDGCVTENAAFNPNDSVDTVQIVNKADFTYDYMVAATTTNIVSRWYVMEAKRKRNGQYELKLRRDMFADSYNEIKNAPAFIEKGTLYDTDPFIFNNEDLTVNQIKKSETLLKDKTGCPWIVGYLANGTTISETSVSYQNPIAYANKSAFDTLWNSYKSTNLSITYPYGNPGIILNGYNLVTKIVVDTGATPNRYRRFNINENGNIYIETTGSVGTGLNVTQANVSNAANEYKDLIIDNLSDLKTAINTSCNIRPSSDLNSLMEYNNKIIYDGNENKYYKVELNITEGSTYNDYFEIYGTQLSPSVISELVDISTDNQYVTITGSDNEKYSYALELRNVTWVTSNLIEVSGENVKYKITNSANHLEDAPYIMFALPYGECTISYLSGGVYTDLDISETFAKNTSLAIANSIIENQGGNNPKLYDIQLLPYCPMQDAIDSDGKILLDLTSYYEFITDSNNDEVSVMLFPLKSRFEFNIPYNISITNVKLENQCDMYRMCSPNWNGQFEFNAAKNGGIKTINVDCEYKPFQPYIHLNPNFGKLYGQDFNDARGLICNGDFSLTQISDAWATYQRQNVNYEKQFNRQIQNMEVNNSIQNTRSAISAITGVVSGSVAGASAGGGIGALIGGTLSAIGGIADIGLQVAGQQEAIDYTKDQFGYSLGNIKALPDSLTKVTAFNNNNKIFPIIEYYSCTDEEKEAFKNKIKYNGMTVMRIGTIGEFLRDDLTYIKGKFIRLEDVLEDFHYTNELANEFNKGVFIK